MERGLQTQPQCHGADAHTLSASREYGAEEEPGGFAGGSLGFWLWFQPSLGAQPGNYEPQEFLLAGFAGELLISLPPEQQGRETDLPAVPRDDFTPRRITRDQSSDLSSPTMALASLFLIQLQKQICSGTGCCAQSVKHSNHQEGRWDYSPPQLHYILNLLKSWKERMANTRGTEKSSPPYNFLIPFNIFSGILSPAEV